MRVRRTIFVTALDALVLLALSELLDSFVLDGFGSAFVAAPSWSAWSTPCCGRCRSASCCRSTCSRSGSARSSSTALVGS